MGHKDTMRNLGTLQNASCYVFKYEYASRKEHTGWTFSPFGEGF